MIDLHSDEYFMQQALKQAKNAFEEDEVPVGAVVVCNGQIIAKAHNLSERLNDVTAHAETQAITAASEFLGGKYLKDCTIYVTLEPCTMCAGALYWSQIKKVVFGAYDAKRGAGRFEQIYHPKTEVIGGILEVECQQLLKSFFESKRQN